MHRQLVARSLRRPLAGLLVCALLLTQAIGLLHRVWHAGGPSALHVSQVLGVFEALFEQHQDAGDCQLFDQLSHADGAGFGLVMPGVLPRAEPPVCALHAPQMAAQAAGYLARGPPRTT